jgi:hypothetical protein
MKNKVSPTVKGSLLLLLSVIFSLTSSFSQSPDKFSYQAVVRNSGGTLVQNSSVGFRISLLQSTSGGTVVYSETHTASTNANGLASLEIGSGSVLSGDFSAIDWSAGPYFLKTETDPGGGSSYTISGTTQLLSVPYAIHSKKAGELDGNITSSQVSDFQTSVTNNTAVLANTSKISYPVADASKLAGIEAGAEVNVNADWNAAGGDAEILNKPSIPTSTSQLTNDSGFLTTISETDPLYSTSQAANITASDITDLSNLSGVNTGDQDLSALATITSLTTGLDLKVDKVTGKGLSSEDYTSVEKTKLSAIAEGAEVNVNVDWNAGSGDALILNKPVIPTTTSQLTNNSGFLTSYTETDPLFSASQAANITAADITDLSNLSGVNTGDQDLSSLATIIALTTGLDTKVDKITGKGLSEEDFTTAEKTKLSGIATGAEINVNADWNAGSGDAQILNKPALATVATTGSYADLINLPVIDGSETKVSSGTNVTVTGSGTNASPYVVNAAGSSGWSLTGNSGTSAATNFIGTINEEALNIRVYNQPVLHFSTDKKFGFNTTTPSQLLHIKDIEIPANALDDDMDGNVDESGDQLVFTNYGRLGINTTAPEANLHVSGTVKITDGTQGAGKVLTSDANGMATWQAAGGGISGSGTLNYIPKFTTGTNIANSQIFDDGTNVGIGTSSPTEKLTISGILRFNLADAVGSATEIQSRIPTGGRITAAIRFENGPTWGDDGNIIFKTALGGSNAIEVMRIRMNGNVGIGTAAPGAKLEVAGNVKITDGTQGAGKVLTSDANGMASWQAAGGGGSHYIGESYGGGIVFYVYDNGQHGLIAATTDQSGDIRWYGGTNTNTRARADGVGAGKTNTAIIISDQGPVDGNNFAATKCIEYSVTADGVTYGDWYLPSKHELNLLYLQIAVVGNFNTSADYWSSTEASSTHAWKQWFSSGVQGTGTKTGISYGYVRAIRAF